MSAPVGTLLSDRYRLDRKIGTGGMSTVFVAFDTLLERDVAIKMMHREIARDSDQLERFRREARAVAKLRHPNIVGVIDAGEDVSPQDGHAIPYIVFEYIEGETLKQRIRRLGRLDVAEAVAYSIEIARALGAAHEAGIVHRDVKPQNVLIDRDGAAKVTDFGIARTLDQEGLTADGRVLGTTDYVSPEQALGRPVTGQSDLYALGVVLFEMVTGEVPFTGENQVQVAMRHVREELPDVRTRRPEVSASLASVLEHATAKDLDERYSDDRELIADLEQVLAVEAQRAGHVDREVTAVLSTLPPETLGRVTVHRDRPRLILTLVAVLALLAAAGIFVWQNTHRGTHQPAVVTQPAAAGLKPDSLNQSAAHDFDPFGDRREHPEKTQNVLDGDPNTSWSTESYDGGKLGKPGVGIYLDAAPGAEVKRLDIRTPTTGWTGRIYAANGSSAPAELAGWTAVSAPFSAPTGRLSVPVDTHGAKYRFYLTWITSLPKPGADGSSAVKISELVLQIPAGA